MDLADLGQTIALLYDALYTPAPPHPKLWEEHQMIREVIDKITTAQLKATGYENGQQEYAPFPFYLFSFFSQKTT